MGPAGGRESHHHLSKVLLGIARNEGPDDVNLGFVQDQRTR